MTVKAPPRPPSINVQLPRDLMNRLNAVCAQRLIGRAVVIRRAIEEVVTRLEAEETTCAPQ